MESPPAQEIATSSTASRGSIVGAADSNQLLVGVATALRAFKRVVRGVERIELLKIPPGFEQWSKVSPLSLESDTTGLFGL